MSQHSSDLFLEYKTQKSNDNPYKTKKKLDKDNNNVDEYFRKNEKNKKKSFYLENKKFSNMYNGVNGHSHLLLLISIILVCIFYTVILRMRHGFIVDKYYHSLSLGLICLIDYLINKEKFQIKLEEQNFNKEEFLNDKEEDNNNEYNQPLINHPTEANLKINNDEKVLMDLIPIGLKKRDLIINCISLGVISFAIEMLTFYLLKITTDIFDKNCSVGFALISFEYIFIRFYYSMKEIRIEFLNFLGLLMIFGTFLFISIEYLSLPLGGVAFFISALRFSKFFLQVELNKYSQLDIQIILLYSNIVDFVIGCLCMFWSILFNKKNFTFDFEDVYLVLIGSLFYYINGKHFRYYDRYCLSISSLIFPFMILFDLLVNKRRIDLFEIILIFFLTSSIVLTFIGDKIWNEDEYFQEIHHRDHHAFHKKNGVVYRTESNISKFSNEHENSDENENSKDRQKNEILCENQKNYSRKFNEKEDSEKQI